MLSLEHCKHSLAAGALTALLSLPILGLELTSDNLHLALKPHWNVILWVSLAVVFWHLFTPVWAGLTHARMARFRAWKQEFWHQHHDTLSPGKWRMIWMLLIITAMIWPFWASRGSVDMLTLAFIYVLLGLGINIVVGYAGLLDLGYVGFYAVGAYTYAILNQTLGWGFWSALPVAALMAALFGFLLGFPVLRLRGDYLAIVTLGFGEIIRLLLRNMNTYTGGPDGISGIAKPTVFGIEMARSASVEGASTFHELLGLTYQGGHMVIYLYLIALMLVLAALFISVRLARLPIGRAWEALREDEIACRSLGLNPTRIKLSAFTLGAAFAGVAGAFFAARQGLVNPESFTFIESALILAVVVLGGMGSLPGVVMAALLITVLPELARSFSEYRMLAFGLIMVLMMMWRPQGLWPATRQHVELP